MLAKGALAVLLVAALAVVAYGADEKKIKCYECKSSDDPKHCENVDSDTKIVDCTTKCVYGSGKTKGEEKKKYWLRGCLKEKETCDTIKETFKNVVDELTCDTCEEDKCNSAASIASSLVLTAVAAMLLKVYY